MKASGVLQAEVTENGCVEVLGGVWGSDGGSKGMCRCPDFCWLRWGKVEVTGVLKVGIREGGGVQGFEGRGRGKWKCPRF